ncbi:hypothetical protein [Myxococcus vastator]|uniref:hypothetical protein n=1 Tax=Myxococcus vastator TaxID=2709664 RepID=UPI0013D85E01|nr:hypothetical protein [Myxococcus vastator]
MTEAPSVDERLERLSRLKPDDREQSRALSAGVRRTLEETAILWVASPAVVVSYAVAQHTRELGIRCAGGDGERRAGAGAPAGCAARELAAGRTRAPMTVLRSEG